MLRHLLVFSLIALLAGCAGLTSHETLEGQGDPAQWKAHKQQISQLDGWQINGKIGIRAPSDSGSATLFWLQVAIVLEDGRLFPGYLPADELARRMGIL